MDPLSVTASAIAIIQLTSELVKGTRTFFQSVRNAPKEVSELVDELTIFGAILERLKSTSQKADEARLHASANGAVKVSQKDARLPMLHKMIKADGPLDICYAEMVAFEEKLAKDPSRIRKSLKWPFRKDEVVAVVLRLRNLRSLLHTAIASDQLALNIEIQDNVSNIRDSLRTAASEELSRKIVDWLSAPDPSSNFETARQKHQQDTGLWLLESPSFLTWKSSPCSLLWLFGKPGSGKTILSSTVIRSLLDEKDKKSTVAYFYFDFQIRDKQVVQNMLNSILVQLFDCTLETFKIIEQFYHSHSRGRTSPTIQESKGAIRQIIDRSSSVYLIIDALDECGDRRILLECLEDVRHWKQDNLHILVTSRRETDIEDCLSVITTDKISLEDSVVDGDILSYVQYHLHHDKDLSKWPENVRTEIEKALTEGAQGMFRWVECQLNAVRGCLKLVHLRKTLRSLPKSLDDTYARILEAIDEDYVEDVHRILSFLVYSFHPLSIQEIADTIAIVTHDGTFYDVEYRLSEPRDILKICSGLVTTTKSMRSTHLGDRQLSIEELRLSHYSVKEYLVSNRMTSQRLSNFVLNDCDTHETLAIMCIRYLYWCHHEGFCEDPDFLLNYGTVYLDKAAFAPYAASCWSRHLRASRRDRSSHLYDVSMELLTHPGILRDTIRLHPPWFRFDEVIMLRRLGYVKSINGNQYLDNEFEEIPPLFYASLLGIDQLVMMLLDRGEDVNHSTSQGTCLSAAASSGHISTVQLLITKGALINETILQKSEKDEVYFSRSAIHETVYAEREEILRFLIAKGANVNVGRLLKGKTPRDLDLNTPLQTAVTYRRKTFVQVLLDAGADPNASGGVYGTALEIASGYAFDKGSFDIMTMLLDAGADPNLTSDPTRLRTPLFIAIQNKHTRGVQILIDRGADSRSIDSRIIPFIVRSHVFDEENFHKVIKILAGLRPDISIDLPLVVAAKYGYFKVIKFILQNGASPDFQESSGLTALQATIFSPMCHNAIIECLLNAGADINVNGGPFGSALQAAALSGKVDVVQLLLEKGASIDYKGGIYGSALTIARNRLDDKIAGFPAVWKPGNRIERYGPYGYFQEDYYPLYAGTLSTTQRPKQNGSYQVKVDIPHWQHADYQAVIDVLLSHGAADA